MSTALTTGTSIHHLRKELKDKIRDGTLDYLKFKNMADTFLGSKTDNSFEALPQLIERPTVEPTEQQTRSSFQHILRTFLTAEPQSLEKIFQNFESGHISFIGATGSGKTSLLRTIARNTMERVYEGLGEVEIVVFVKCGDLNTAKRLTLPARLFLSCIQPELDDKDVEQFDEYAKAHPQKVMFILDGLDTFPEYFYKSQKPQKQKDNSKGKRVFDILLELMKGDLFPNCRVITSCRAYTELGQNKLRTNRVVTLAGLTEESVFNIVHQYFKPNEAEKIVHYLVSDALVFQHCLTPMFLIFTLIGKKEDSSFAPTMKSEILLFLFQSLIRSEHSKLQHDDIQSLGSLCYDLMKEGRVNFSQEDLNKHNLSPEKVEDFTITARGVQNKTMFFVHKSIMEVLSCFHIAGMNPSRLKIVKNKHLKSPAFEAVSCMLCGILINDKIYSKWKALVEEKHLEEKRKIMMAHLEDQLCKPRDYLHLLDVILSVHEAGDAAEALVKRSMESIVLDPPQPIFLSASDAQAIGTVASRCDKLKEFVIKCSILEPNHLTVLTSRILKTLPKITLLDFSGNIFTPDGMLQIGYLAQSCFVQVLVLASCLEFELTQPQEMLRCLKLGLKEYQLNKLKISYREESLSEEKLTPNLEGSNMEITYVRDTNQKIENKGFSDFIPSKIQRRVPIPGMWKNATYQFVHAAASLLSNVKEDLYMYCWKVSGRGKNLLQRTLENIGSDNLKVHFSEDDILTSNPQMPSLSKASKLYVTSQKFVEVVEYPEKMAANLGRKSADAGRNSCNETLNALEDNEKIKILSQNETKSQDEISTGCDKTVVEKSKKSAAQVDEVDKTNCCKLQIAHRPATDYSISSLISSMPDFPHEIELRNCDLKKTQLLKFLDGLKSMEKNVSTLSITAMSGIDELIPTITELLKICKTECLNMEESTGSENFVRLLLESVKDLNPRKFCSLNLSYNKSIKDFKSLGELLSGRMRQLKMVNCNLETRQLKTVCESLDHGEVEHLDFSYNAELVEEDIRLLPRILTLEKPVSLVALRGCELSEDELEGFCGTEFDSVQVRKLDLSYNTTLQSEGVEVVGSTVRKLNVDDLALGTCNLDKESLESLTTSLDGHKLSCIDLRGNTKISSNTETVAVLLKSSQTSHLNISNCRLTAEQVSTFVESLGTHKLSELRIGDSECAADKDLIEAICELLPFVGEKLNVCFPNIEDHLDRLQVCINKSQNKKLRIVYRESVEERCEEDFSIFGPNQSRYLMKQ